MKKHGKIFRGLTVIFILFIFVFVLAAVALEGNRTMVDQNLGTNSTLIITEDGGDDSLYTAYKPDEDMLTDGKADDNKVRQAFTNFGRETAKEGAVLLKNESVGGKPALPLN